MQRKFRFIVLALMDAAIISGLVCAFWFRPATQAQATSNIIYGLTANQQLISFNSLTPHSINSTRAITGVAAGDTLVGIDFRPATGQLYAVSSGSRLYTINPVTGAATAVGTTPFSPVLNSAVFGIDFNPIPDRIRLVTDAEQNLRLHPDTGAVAGVDTNVAYAPGDANANANPAVVSAAYTNNIAGTTTTTLYVLDANRDILVRQGSVGGTPDSPNGGRLFTVGALGVNIGNATGFDIAAPGDVAYVSATVPNGTATGFYSINLTTGALTLVGTIGGGQLVRDIAVATNFIPPNQPAQMAVTNAASFVTGMVAPNSIAAAFGGFQTTNGQVAVANALPLPTTLNGVSLTVNGTPAGLFFVSNGQINFAVPANAADGLANVVVTSVNGTRAATINIVRAAPGIFTALGNGQGTAAALSTFDGATYQLVANADGSPRAVDPGTPQRPNYLVLFTTGVRRTPAANPNDGNGVAESVSVTMAGIPCQVPFAGGVAEGLDQINAVIPWQLTGAGDVPVQVITNGQVSNTAIVRIGGAPPRVDTTPVTFGQTVAGALTETDQVLRAPNGRTYFFDAHSFTARAGMGLAVDLRAPLFDALVMLYKRNADGSLTWLAADDNLGGLGAGDLANTNALLLTYLTESSDYVVLVTSANDEPNATGGYQLRVNANALQPLAYGSTANGVIGATDVQTSAGDYLDVYWFAGNAGDNAQMRMSAATFDPVLILAKNNGELIAADDNGGSGTDALIRRTLDATGVYVVIATPFEPFITGGYSLSLTRGAAALAEETQTLSRASRLLKRGVADTALRRIEPREE
jgi:uncharacterized protein (TIGR03437 family)